MLRRKKVNINTRLLVVKNIICIGFIGWIRAGTQGMPKHLRLKKLLPAKMITNAFIFDKNHKYVWTFASYDTESAVFSDRNTLFVVVLQN